MYVKQKKISGNELIAGVSGDAEAGIDMPKKENYDSHRQDAAVEYFEACLGGRPPI